VAVAAGLVWPSWSSARTPPAGTRLTVAATGDFLIHTPVFKRALAYGGGRRYDFRPMLRVIKPTIAGADLALCHFETPLSYGPPRGYPSFRTPVSLAPAVQRAGWDACSTASNHTLDAGVRGVNTTLRVLNRIGLRHAGSYRTRAAARRPTILRAKGVKVAFLAYTTDTNGIPLPHPWSVNIASAGRILDDAKRAHKLGAEAVIVNIHWGGEIVAEYDQQPSSGQLALVKKLTASPLITAIVGQGPHAVQPIEHINDKFVVFSEGNLISNQSPAYGLPAESQDGMVALLSCVTDGDGTKVTDVHYVPVFVSQPDYTVLPVGSALEKGEGDATLLRDSYDRTVSVVGKSKHIEPIPNKLPAG
jgi:hypothetical protein